MLHAENGDVIEILTEEALAAGHSEAIWHAITRPAWGAVEAVLRGVALAQQADAPLYVVHVNTAGGADQIRYGRKKITKLSGRPSKTTLCKRSGPITVHFSSTELPRSTTRASRWPSPAKS